MTTAGPQFETVKHAREAEQRATKAKVSQEMRDAPLIALMGTEVGRAVVRDEWLHRLFVPIGREDGAHRWDAEATAYAIGKHDDALDMWRRLKAACPELLAALVAESINQGNPQ